MSRLAGDIGNARTSPIEQYHVDNQLPETGQLQIKCFFLNIDMIQLSDSLYILLPFGNFAKVDHICRQVIIQK